MSAENLLQHGSLSGKYNQFRNNESVQTATGWLPWWAAHKNGEPEWKNQTPSYQRLETRTKDGGAAVQRLETPWATHTAGLLQQVPAAPGNRYKLVAECQAWSSEDDEPETLVDASDVHVQIGIDPTGGLDPKSPLIVWSEVADPLGKWKKLKLEAEAENSIITVYLKSAPDLPKRQQSILWRNVRLEPRGQNKQLTSIVGAGDTHILLSPEQPLAGDRVTATVSSSRNQVYIGLQVHRPDNEKTTVDFKGITQEEGRYIWRYEFAASESGQYDVRFVGDNGGRLLAQRLIQVTDRDRLADAAEQSPSGQPRLDYHRVYVLLPPTADSKWIVAAAKGSFERRFTIGFSADDAGLGELSSRQVLAINPHHWPQPMTAAWFHQHYPGTVFTAVVANSPADLENWLRNWMAVE